MHRSRDRFLTTHTGSLPRPDDLIRTMHSKEAGVPLGTPGATNMLRIAYVGREAAGD